MALLVSSLGWSQSSIHLGGSGTETSNYSPNYYLYNYSYSQVIYTAAEMVAQGAVAGEITKIKYKAKASASTTDWKDWIVYMGTTSKTNFSSTTDWVPVASLTQVFAGEIPSAVVANEWMEITLSTPFTWDGSSNIVVAVDENTPDYGGSPSWAGYILAPSSGNKSIYYYSDTNNPNPASPPTASGRSNTVAQIQFVGNLLAPCTGTPSAGSASASPSRGTEGSTYVLSATGATNGIGLTFQWESNSGSGWTPVGTSSSEATSHTATAQGPVGTVVEWRLKATCTASNESAYSTVASFTTDLYCTPSATNTTRFINNFSTTGGTVNISNLNSGFSPGGYGNFVDTHSVSQMVGESVSFTTDISGGTAGFRVWVDWNQNGTFEANEVAYASTGYGNSQSGTITIPTNALTGATRMRVVSHYLSSTGDTSPCTTAFTNGEFEDYEFVVAPLPACTGTPAGGTASANPTSGNIGTTYTVSSAGFTTASGLSFQWESNTGSGWAASGDATEFYGDKTATAQGPVGATVDWRLKVTCVASNESSYSTIATFTSERVYCTPSATNSSRFINNFSTEDGLTNISNMGSGFSAGGYGNFTATHSVSQMLGETIDVNADISGGTAGLRVWVDWNQNGTFEADEVAYASTVYGNSQSGTITVPTDALTGATRMRVVSHYLSSTGDTSPCTTAFTNGEFEDYEFVVVPLPGCTGTPAGGTASIDPSSGNIGTAYTVSSTGYTIAAGLSFQWESDTGSGWAASGDATEFYEDKTATAQGPIGDTVDWRLKVTCVASNESSYSTVVTFTSEKVYCIPAATNTARYIDDFSTSNGITDITNMSSGFSTGGYGDFFDTHSASQLVGEDIDFEASFEGGTFGFRIWVDWNQNGTFEADEVVYASSGYADNHSGSFTVPDTALSGDTRMRIVNHWSSTTGDASPCATAYATGEFEDYKFTVVPASVPVVYCTPEGTNSARFINNFSTTGALVNTSNLNSGFSAGGYGDFYDTHLIQQVANENVSFAADISGGTAGFRIWVDWNQDGEFTADEVAYQSSGYANSQTGSFQVPASALPGSTRMRIVSHWLSTTGDVDPCETGFTYGEFEDYKFVVQALTPCAGTPDGGTATVTPNEGNIGSTYQVSASGYSIASGMSFQWESNTDDAGWIDEGTPTEFYEAFSATAPDEVGVEVAWRLKVTCVASNESSYSTVATFTTVKVYCTPGATNNTRFINNFSTTGGNPNVTNMGTGFSTGGYGDYYDTHTVGQIPGESVDFAVDISGGTAGFRIWIDWNQNGTFEADEVAYASSSYENSHTGSFTVPATALEGETRMRIVSHWLSNTGDVDPCATGFTYGEFEDYKFVVSELTDCTGTPNAGAATVTPAIGAPDSTYTVSASGFSINAGLAFQWESNTDGAGWVDEGASLNDYQPFTATAPSEMDVQVEWRLKVTCTASNESAYSTTATFTTGITYCTPGAICTDGDNITNVTFREINNSTTCSPGGYGDYTHLTATVEAGQSYPISVTVGDGWFERVSLWVDWGQDGVFDDSDYLGEIGEGGQGVPLEDIIAIPAGTADGNYRMRFMVGAVGNDNPAPDDPCLNNPAYFGEFEDYTLVVDNQVGTTDHAVLGFAFYPNPVNDVLYLESDVSIESVSGFNVLGQQVIGGKQFQNGKINVSHLSSGAYVFHVKFVNGMVETFRVLKD